MTAITTAKDVTSETLNRIFNRARDHEYGKSSSLAPAKIVGLLFLERSLRTEFGFATAAARLGWQAINAHRRSAGERSMNERVQDTLRVVSGYTDVLIARLGQPITLFETQSLDCAFLNGGDTGAKAEHPSQAIIDIYAMEQLQGPISELTVAICGDLKMRVTRSLLSLLAQTPPKRLLCTTLPELIEAHSIPEELNDIVEFRTVNDMHDADVIYATGISNGAIDEYQRVQLRITRKVMSSLNANAVVLSPMPVIDEISTSAQRDRRAQFSDKAISGSSCGWRFWKSLRGVSIERNDCSYTNPPQYSQRL